MKRLLAILLSFTFSGMAWADNATSGQYYIAGGGGAQGAFFSIGAGNKVDVLELNYIELGKVSNGGTAKFTGLSLVQNATPKNGFNFLFRIGIGREITTFPGGAKVGRDWFNSGIYAGIGEQYQPSDHLAIRAEVNRIVYAASPDGKNSGVRYPLTLSVMYIF
jgi:opacity protein-like surface antigen